MVIEKGKPVDCKHYPFCEPLQTRVRDLPQDLIITRVVVLQREAELICRECLAFEPEKTMSTS